MEFKLCMISLALALAYTDKTVDIIVSQRATNPALAIF